MKVGEVAESEGGGGIKSSQCMKSSGLGIAS